MSLHLNYWQHLEDTRSPNGHALNVFYDQNSRYPIIVLTTAGEIFRYSICDKKWIEYYYHDSINLVSSLFKNPKTGYIIDTLLNNKKNAILFVFIYANKDEGYMNKDKLCIAELKLNKQNEYWKNRVVKIIHESFLGEVDGTGSCPIIIKDRFHLIGGYINKKHALLNKDGQKFKTLHNVYNETIKINYARLVKAGNFVLSFGGSEKYKWEIIDYIHQYDIGKNKWKRLKITMPKLMTRFGCVTIMNDKYIVFFGGHYHAESYDDIYIYSVENKMFRLSNVKYPQRGECHVVAVNDKLKEELSVYGFVRYQWKILPLHQQLFPPKYLIHIIRKYYHIEYIHLFHKNGHWRIDIFDLIWFNIF